MIDEFKAYQDAIVQVGASAENLNKCRAALHAAIDKKATETGAQVASDTSIKAPETKPA
jgi:hypothetical protein